MSGAGISINFPGSNYGRCYARNVVLDSCKVAFDTNDAGGFDIRNCIITNSESAFNAYDQLIYNVDYCLTWQCDALTSGPSASQVQLGANVFQADPRFVCPGKGDYRLQDGSPAIDAGDPASAYNDANLPPSLGAARNDLGAYGGPNAYLPAVPSGDRMACAGIVVPAVPLWTYTGMQVNAGDTIYVSASPGDGQGWTWNKACIPSFGPEGHTVAPPTGCGTPTSPCEACSNPPFCYSSTWDLFLNEQAASHGQLIAFVGPTPYSDSNQNALSCGGTSYYTYYRWYGFGDSRNGEAQLPGFFGVGASSSFVSPAAGKLWLGFNDDAASNGVCDNAGYVVAAVSVNAPLPHAVDIPSKPSGSDSGNCGQSLLFSSSSRCNQDHPVEYRFDWGDGTQSDWTSGSASHSWSNNTSGPLAFQVKALARCSVDHNILSLDWSPVRSVTINPCNVQCPTLNPIGGPVPARPGQPFSLQLSTTNPAQHAVTYAVVQPVPLPDNATFDSASGLLAWTPSDGQVGIYDFVFSLHDRDVASCQDSTQACTIRVLSCQTATPPCPAPPGRTLTVPGSYSTIQKAIDAASDGDTILVKPKFGGYAECIDFKGKSVTLKSTDGPNRTSIVGTQGTFYSSPVVIFKTCEQRCSVLDGFTIKQEVNELGGGIFVEGASPTIRNCYVTENVGDARDTGPGGRGGGIYVTGHGACPLIDNTLIYDNTATADPGGGGICIDNGASADIQHCTLNHNIANIHGGGLYVSATSSANVLDSIIWGNLAGTVDNSQDIWNDGLKLNMNWSDTSDLAPINTGVNNKNDAPGFIEGTLGRHYIDNSSPAVNAGDREPSAELAARTTHKDGNPDDGVVDLGFHYEKHPIWIAEAYTGDLNGTRQSVFSPGEPMTYNVKYIIEEPAGTTYAAICSGKRGAQTFSKSEKHPAGTYVLRIAKKAPAATGNKKATVTMKLKNAAKTTLISTDKVQVSFQVQ